MGYAQYKDSGINWIGAIPKHWKISRLRFLGSMFGGLTGKTGENFNQDGNPNNKPYIPYTNIFNNTYVSKNDFHYVVLGENEKQNRVKKYDLFFLMSSETYQDLGKSCILIDNVDELYLNSFCKGFRVTQKGLNPLFLNYQLLGQIHRELISVEGRGFTRINLRQGRLMDIPILLPPSQEQRQIISFLNTKTALIDSMIEKIQKKIELLQEQRTELVNRCVTKGLDPNAKMKNSDIEWVGRIPKHWEVKKLKHLGVPKSGNGFKISLQGNRQGSIPFYKVSDTNLEGNEMVLSSSSNYISLTDVIENGFYLFDERTIVFPKVGEVLKLNKRRILTMKSCMDNNMMGLTIFSEDNIEYLYFLLTRLDFVFFCSDGTLPSISERQIGAIRVPVPPIAEQYRILDYLQRKLKILDKMITVENKRKRLLSEYRQSLISSVVTGKICVMEDVG